MRGYNLDFSGYELSNRYYAGSEYKIGIQTPDGTCYMLKFRKATAFGRRFNHVSEYLGSHIFSLAGMEAQETYLGTYQSEPVVACRDFNTPTTQFVPFNEVGESTLEEDKESYQYDYVDIMRMLRDNSKLTNVDETISAFWRMYVVDALLGNFDRHGANWGFLKSDDGYALAPVFDNGSCLFPGLVEDEEVERVLGSQDEMLRRVYRFPTSQVRLDGRKSSYDEVIGSLEFPECNVALQAVMRTLDMDAVHDLVSEVPFTSSIRKDFYHAILDLRYRLILKRACDRLGGQS